jgi:predicted nuclease with TOPRIM domain
MLEKALMWLAQAVLNWMALKLQKKVVNLYELAKEEKEFEKTNTKNVEKYNAAKDRLEKIKAAQELLNRTKS